MTTDTIINTLKTHRTKIKAGAKLILDMGAIYSGVTIGKKIAKATDATTGILAGTCITAVSMQNFDSIVDAADALILKCGKDESEDKHDPIEDMDFADEDDDPGEEVFTDTTPPADLVP